MLTVTFERPTHGWLPVAFDAPTWTFRETFSNVPANPHVGLVDALFRLWRNPERVVLVWNTEPIEYELHFEPEADGRLRFSVVRRARRERVFVGFETRERVCLTFWRALRRFETSLSRDAMQTHWRDFPTHDMTLLSRAIRESK